MKALGHQRIDILKIDIEGSEYSVIDNIIKEKIEIDQLLIEFHHRFKEIPISESQEAIRKLRSYGFKLFDVSESREEYSFIRNKAPNLPAPRTVS